MIVYVNEIFYSIQGESRWMGYPCIFVRLAGCNLRCKWCDTEYAFGPGVAMSIDEILERIRPHPCKLVEVTGGEPLLQSGSIDLMRALLEQDYRVLLETGGSLSIREVPANVVKVLDVKCPGSGEAGRNIFENFQYLLPTDDVKFVIKDRIDFEYAVSVIREHGVDARCGLLFSPVWGELPFEQLAAWLLEAGIYARMQVQLHKLIWGATARGV